MEDALAGRTIAKEHGGDAARLGAAAAEGLGERDARSHREFTADDGRDQHDPEFDGGDVQRAALALAVAVHPAEHLGHRAARVGTAGEQLTGTAMVGEDAVMRLKRAHHADCTGLLLDRRAGAGRTRAGERGQRFFVTADPQHRIEHLEAGSGLDRRASPEGTIRNGLWSHCDAGCAGRGGPRAGPRPGQISRFSWPARDG